MKILIVSYLYPPVGGGGVQRVLTLSDFLTVKGEDVSVYTEQKDKYHYDVYDFSNTGNSSVKILTSAGIEGNRFENNKQVKILKDSEKVDLLKKIRIKLYNMLSFIFPDNHNSFLFRGIKDAKNNKENYDIVLGTVRPPSNAIIAYYFSKARKVPLVIEYRDLWFGQEFQKQSSLYKFFNKIYEHKVLKHAQKIVCVSPAFVSIFKSRYPELTNKLVLITNGFPNQYLDIKPSQPVKKNEQIVIAHFGRFYGPRKIDELVVELSQCSDHLSFHQYGPKITNSQLDLTKYSFFVEKGYVDFNRSWEIQKGMETDILILIEYTSDNIPGKIFEYYASDKPVIVICPSGSVLRSVFNDVEGFYFFDNAQLTDVSKHLMDLIPLLRAGLSFNRDKQVFNRNFLYEKYIKLLSESL